MKAFIEPIANELIGIWEGEALSNDLFSYVLHINKRNTFELLDIENEELLMGMYSVEFTHDIFYLILNANTEVLVMQWDGRRELKSNDLILKQTKDRKEYLFGN